MTGWPTSCSSRSQTLALRGLHAFSMLAQPMMEGEQIQQAGWRSRKTQLTPHSFRPCLVMNSGSESSEDPKLIMRACSKARRAILKAYLLARRIAYIWMRPARSLHM